jgi:hypothetical protein
LRERGKSQCDGAGSLPALGLVSLAAQEGEGEVEAFDFALPAFRDRAAASGDQVLLDFVEAASMVGLTLSIGQRMQA